ncbi:MAG: hypothetical protein IPL26_03230 [Leptospiraceae bacterium]|nr:hypothetical protein [Leptospiraceae bacterium]
MKYNLKILENANELIESIACDSLAEGERLSERGDKPTARCHHQVQAGLTQTQSFLFKKEMIIAIVR